VARTEQEQIEAFSNWWKSNGTLVVAAVIISLSAYFGWSAWQKHQQTQSAEASILFQQILERREGKAVASDEKPTSELADQLKNNYAKTYYGQAVRLLLAEEAVKNGKLESAEQELTALVAQKPDRVLAYMARLRLGRVLFAQGKYDEALTQLSKEVPDAYKTLFAELQGDVLVAQAQPDKAREAYMLALNSLPEGNTSQKGTIEMKMNGIAAK
jgi:predicted negative regulator of RcsB-dependent stress response